MAADSELPVLVVDDNRTMLRIVRSLLFKLGFLRVDEALDGAAALAKMRDKRYGLVIADWNMETMSGFELLRQVRADDSLKQIPFIIMTAEARGENVVAARKVHVDNFIVKPFNASTLKAKMDEACAGGGRAW